MLEGKSIQEAIQIGLSNAEKCYSDSEFVDEVAKYSRLWREDFATLSEEEIKSTGDDSDTVAAVAGGLAGIYYGMGEIPEEWLLKLQNRESLEDIATNFFHSIGIEVK